MTYFEMFMSALFSISVLTIGTLVWRLLSKQQASLDSLKMAHYRTKDEHEEVLNDHSTELEKHKLEIQHSRDLATRAEQEMKTLMEDHNKKFDQVIDIFKQTLRKS